MIGSGASCQSTDPETQTEGSGGRLDEFWLDWGSQKSIFSQCALHSFTMAGVVVIMRQSTSTSLTVSQSDSRWSATNKRISEILELGYSSLTISLPK